MPRYLFSSNSMWSGKAIQVWSKLTNTYYTSHSLNNHSQHKYHKDDYLIKYFWMPYSTLKLHDQNHPKVSHILCELRHSLPGQSIALRLDCVFSSHMCMQSYATFTNGKKASSEHSSVNDWISQICWCIILGKVEKI